MKSDNEIRALLVLIDDPDDEVFDTVASELLNYGRDIIPRLEQLWEVTPEEAVQTRIEDLIHRVHFQDLRQEFADWSRSDHPELLRGAILVAKFQYPQLNIPEILNQFDQIRKNVWLELNNYLSPMEQVNVFNSILYSFYKLQGHELTERDPKYFFINQVLQSRQGNSYSIGVIYLALCEILDVPVFAIDVPRQFIFAYIHVLPHVFNAKDDYSPPRAQFYIDPLSGIVYSQKDVDAYLEKINALDREMYLTPILNKRIIFRMMEELCLCYRYRREDEKADDIQELMKLLIEQ
ncbi:MAG: hypothetical protein H7257_05950 [Taibaiella sp.]|nr:hypothetical protein [Taibaiella sp.]